VLPMSLPLRASRVANAASVPASDAASASFSHERNAPRLSEAS
jgi:hypothetical protein